MIFCKRSSAKEGSQLVTNCNQLKMQSADGKFYLTDVADSKTAFTINLLNEKDPYC